MTMDDAKILGDQVFVLENVAGGPGEHASSSIEDDRLIRNVEC
jgi:hypothetical protein